MSLRLRSLDLVSVVVRAGVDGSCLGCSVAGQGGAEDEGCRCHEVRDLWVALPSRGLISWWVMHGDPQHQIGQPGFIGQILVYGGEVPLPAAALRARARW